MEETGSVHSNRSTTGGQFNRNIERIIPNFQSNPDAG